MAVDMFLKIDGIKGESGDPKHPGEIEIESFSFGQAGDVNDGGQREGRVNMQDFHFVMRANKASPDLMLKCAKGEKLGTGYTLLTARRAGANPVEFLKIKFYDALVSSFQNAGAETDVHPVDQFALWFGKIEVSYTEIDPAGKLGETRLFKWDRIKGESYP